MNHRITKLSFDIISERHRNTSARQIEIPLLDDNSDGGNKQSKYKHQMFSLNDSSHTFKRQQNTFFQYLCAWLTQNIEVISPDSTVLFVWNIFNSLIILYNFIQIPIIIFLADKQTKSQDQYLFLLVMNVVTIFFITADMVFVRPRIAYYQNEALITSYDLMIKKYISKQLFFDGIPLIALLLYIVIDARALIFIRIVFYFKIVTLLQINQELQEKILFSPYIWALFKFLRMVSFIYFITSLIACIYFAIDYHYYQQKGFNYQKGFIWLHGSGTVDYMDLIQIYSWPVWYEYALYWAVQTSAGVGYGNMTPRNPAEVLLCNLVILTTIVMFVFFANTVIDIVNGIQQSNMRKQQKMSELNNFTSVNQISKQEKNKIQYYIQSLIKTNNDEDQKYIYQILSQQLKTNFRLSYKRQIFDNIDILSILTKHNGKWNFFAQEIVDQIQINYCSNGDLIMKNNQTDNFIIGMIVRGKITVFNAITDYEKDFRQWEYFGQRQFFFGGIIINKIICRTFTKYYYFQKLTFFKILKKYPQIYEQCCQLIDDVKFNRKKTTAFEISCENCDKQHLLERCPINSLWRDRLPKIKRQYIEDRPHERVTFYRKTISSMWVKNGFVRDTFNVDQFHNTVKYFPFDNISQ